MCPRPGPAFSIAVKIGAQYMATVLPPTHISILPAPCTLLLRSTFPSLPQPRLHRSRAQVWCARNNNRQGMDDIEATSKVQASVHAQRSPARPLQHASCFPLVSWCGSQPTLETTPFLALHNNGPGHRSSHAFSKHQIASLCSSIDCTVSAMWGSVPRGAR